ncbi:MAG: hypothetical protein ACRC0G_04465, partial [Fusobacteriaceae bacterium]
GDIYKIRMTLVDKNSKRTFYQNTIQVYDKLSDLIEVKNDFFEKIRYNKTVTMRNDSMINSKDLNCFLSHFVNGSLVKSYPPVFKNKEVDFNITKQVGLNKLIFNYNNDKVEVSSFDFKNEIIKIQKIYDVVVNDNVLYSKNDYEYILTNKSDISLKTEGLRYVRINSRKLGRIIEKTVADNFTCKISSSWLPCELEALDAKKEKVDFPILKFKILTNNKFSFKIKSNKKNSNAILKFKVNSSKPKVKSNIFKNKLTYYDFHKFFSYANGVATNSSNTEWLKLDKLERNNIIKNITAGVLDEKENKKIIKKYLGGK